MMTFESLVFIVDLNEAEAEDVLPVSLDYTDNFGLGVMAYPSPAIGSAVRVHSPDDHAIYDAVVLEQVSDRDLTVRVNWGTERDDRGTTEPALHWTPSTSHWTTPHTTSVGRARVVQDVRRREVAAAAGVP
jgi:hypothetical protein